MIEVSLRLPLRQKAGEGTPELPALVEHLRQEGIDGERIQVLSREPLAEFPAAPSRMSKIGILGAMFGFSAAIGSLVAMTLGYKLNTGGMPLISPFPIGVITYEMTLLGSFIAMLLTLFLAAKLGPGRRAPEHPELDYGEAIVSVACGNAEQARQARQLLAGYDSTQS